MDMDMGMDVRMHIDMQVCMNMNMAAPMCEHSATCTHTDVTDCYNVSIGTHTYIYIYERTCDRILLHIVLIQYV